MTVELTTSVAGDLIKITGVDTESVVKQLDDLKGNEDFFDRLTELKQLGVAKGVFSGPAQAAPALSTGTPPPPDNTPTCSHGKMKDLRGKGYKSDFYCTEKNRDNQCKPVKL